jgi:hypothetical protein
MSQKVPSRQCRCKRSIHPQKTPCHGGNMYGSTRFEAGNAHAIPRLLSYVRRPWIVQSRQRVKTGSQELSIPSIPIRTCKIQTNVEACTDYTTQGSRNGHERGRSVEQQAIGSRPIPCDRSGRVSGQPPGLYTINVIINT